MAKDTGRPFAVFDIDGTLIRWQLYHAVADELAKQGYTTPKTYQAMREARMTWKRRTDDNAFKDYEAKVIVAYEKALLNLTLDQLIKIADKVFDEYKEQVYIYTRNLIAELKAKNYMLLAISGSQSEIVEKVVNYWGFDDYLATVYAQEDARFTGQKIVHSDDKKSALNKMVTKHNLNFKGSIGVGDTRSDIPMLEIVERPIAFNPEKELFAHAKSKGWKIVIERKNMIYELEKLNGRYQLA